MNRYIFLAAIAVLAYLPERASATALPERVATIVVHGFNPGGGQNVGVFGADGHSSFVAPLATSLGLPTVDVDPTAKNQITWTLYYGTQYPNYYTPQDIADLEAITLLHGGGVPRYAMIVAKFAKEVMRRSGADQVNIYAESFGGLVSRYLIEKDVEGLASSGRIARWIPAVGVLAGNYMASRGGEEGRSFFTNYYGAEPKDLEHMQYEWVESNLNNPRDSSVSPFLGQFPVHFWQGNHDEFNSKFLTLISRRANDGVVLSEDAVLRNLPPQSQYLGRKPTLSSTHTTHETFGHHPGLDAGLKAQLFGRKRVTITLEDVRVRNEFDGGFRGDGEYVFGVKVYSFDALHKTGLMEPIHDLRAEDNNAPFIRMEQGTTETVNLTWFDDMVLPDETHLSLVSKVDEIDGDYIYDIWETTEEAMEPLAETLTNVSVMTPGRYTTESADWRGVIRVEIMEYPPFDPAPVTAADNWNIYK